MYSDDAAHAVLAQPFQHQDFFIEDKPRSDDVFRPSYRHLAHGAVRALLVAATSAGGADDNHATALATVLVGRHICLVGESEEDCILVFDSL